MKYIILHHTATLRDSTSVEAIEKDHIKRFGRMFYHYVISPEKMYAFSHEPNYRGPEETSIDIALTGDFRIEPPVLNQIQQLYRLISETPHDKIINHKEALSLGLVASRSVCPVINLVSFVDRLKIKVSGLPEHIDIVKPFFPEVEAFFGGQIQFVFDEPGHILCEIGVRPTEYRSGGAFNTFHFAKYGYWKISIWVGDHGILGPNGLYS